MKIQKSYDGSNCLYIIPTPIGNLEDITYRTISTLKMVDIIFCEDTRVTGQLLKKMEIEKKLISCNDINEEEIKNKIIDFLNQGKDVGLVSDRGTPVISDPGYKSIIETIKNDYNVVCLPGATAFVPALVCSGLKSSPFLFYGFLNSKSNKRIKELETLRANEATIIFYESPHRLNQTLLDMKSVFGNRNISISRELTKLFEEIFRGNLDEAIEYFDGNLKGEFVIVVDGENNPINYDEMSVEEHINAYISMGFSNMDAIKMVAKDRSISKSEIYKIFHGKGH